MKKLNVKYVCQFCGYESPRWLGKCPNCEQWNSFLEEISEPRTKKGAPKSNTKTIPLAEVDSQEEPRINTNLNELNRVLGGGIVKGSVILIGGDPGIGKSTLMLQMLDNLNEKISLYITGEESLRQLKLRAERLNIKDDRKILLVSETDLDLLIPIIKDKLPDVVIVDSIQTIYRSSLENLPGSINQIRESTSILTRIAKENNIPVFIVGHITKEGIIAGPKIIEHMVDTVLQFEGEQHHAYRILRCLKNRFGSTNEVGIFEMYENGLREVKNPSEVFLSERIPGTNGSSVVASMEGSRPILVEVQALVTQSKYGMPQRNTTGFDYRRLALLIAVLEKRVGVQISSYDVFVNIAGGLKIDEPAIDLGIAASIMSSLKEIPVEPKTVVIGEVGLAGEIRTVSQPEKRIQEAAKLGFKRIVLPSANKRNITKRSDIELIGVDTVSEAFERILV